MRKLSVTEYLIAQNQAQSTVTVYHSMLGAIEAALSEVKEPAYTAFEVLGADFDTEQDSYGRVLVNYFSLSARYSEMAIIKEWREVDNTSVYTIMVND